MLLDWIIKLKRNIMYKQKSSQEGGKGGKDMQLLGVLKNVEILAVN